jgi:hypothetical protein
VGLTSTSRRFRRLRAWGALVAFVGTLGLPLATVSHQMWGDDRACLPTGPGLDHATVQFEAVLPAGPADHCAVCHWLRTARGARVGASESSVSLLQATNLLVLPHPSRPASEVITHRPSRAPPRIST